MLYQAEAFSALISSNRSAREPSSARPQWQASSSRFPPVPVSSRCDQHPPPDTPPGQVTMHSLENIRKVKPLYPTNIHPF